jgi:hypothetical protein
MMRGERPENSPSPDPAAQERRVQREQFVALLRSPARWSRSPAAFLAERAALISSVGSPVWVQGTLPPPLLGVGSSSTTTGSTRFRGTSGTALSSTACRRLKRTRSAATSTSAPSGSGTASGKTSDSSRRWNAAASTIGTGRDAEIAEVVDRIAGYRGAHRSGYWSRVADRLRDAGDGPVPARAHYEEVE